MVDFSIFFFYWLCLGIASTIGLGTGFHTFILYLGPHIVQVTLAAYECNSIPGMLPSKWRFDHFAVCQKVSPDQTSITPYTIFMSIWLEAFIFGTGTAIGELPPYFVARAASMAGHQVNELSEFMNDDEDKPEDNAVKANQGALMSFFDRHKKTFIKLLKDYAFITVLAMASVSERLSPLPLITETSNAVLCVPFRYRTHYLTWQD